MWHKCHLQNCHFYSEVDTYMDGCFRLEPIKVSMISLHWNTDIGGDMIKAYPYIFDIHLKPYFVTQKTIDLLDRTAFSNQCNAFSVKYFSTKLTLQTGLDEAQDVGVALSTLYRPVVRINDQSVAVIPRRFGVSCCCCHLHQKWWNSQCSLNTLEIFSYLSQFLWVTFK